MRRFFCTLFIVLLSAAVSGQDLNNLKSQNNSLKEQEKAVQKLIGENRSKTQNAERERKLLQNKIDIKQKMIRNLEQQTAAISGEITSTTREVRDLDLQLETLKDDYGKVVYESWKNHKMNTAVAFLFASRDFNDATRRVSHMKRYNRMRETQAAKIDSLSNALNSEVEKLAVRKQELDESKAEEAKAVEELDVEKKQLASVEAALKSDRQKLDREARALKDKIAKNQKEIDKIIADQAKAQAARTKAQKKEDVILSGKLEENRGKLPWPVAGGFVLHGFGQQKVNASGSIEVNFKGIEIAAPSGAPVRAVFEGEVTGVYDIDRFNYCVTVRSGSYIILYANLAKTSVKQGEKVAINQQVGVISDDADATRHTLIFQLWHEKTAQDPQKWLRKQ